MSQKNQIVYALMSVLLLFVFVLVPMKAEAGLNEYVLDNTMLDSANWSNPEDDVLTEQEKIIFTADSTQYSRLISKQTVKVDKLFENLVQLSANVEFQNFPSNQSFIFAFGLEGIESMAGEAPNVEVTFTNNGGIKVGVVAYDEDGTMHTVSNPTSCGITLHKAVKVVITITTDSKIRVAVNGNNVCSGTLPVSGEGSVGFLQSGQVAVELSDFEMKYYEYSRPENTNIYEDFEKGGMDVSVLTARAPSMDSIFPRGQSVEEYEGNMVLMHRHTDSTYLGTLYQYSNFQITFDVPYLHTVTEYDETGKLLIGGMSRLMISMGNEQADWDTAGWEKAVETVVIGKDLAYSFNNPEKIQAIMKKDPFAGEGRPFSVKVTVVDAVVTASLKWLEDEQFEEVLSYKLEGGTPTGYVQIWLPEYGNCAIDNLEIINLDENPNIIETEYKNGKWEIPADFKYESAERVYADDKQVEGTTNFSDIWFIPVGAVFVGGFALLVTFVSTRKKKKEELSNEK